MKIDQEVLSDIQLARLVLVQVFYCHIQNGKTKFDSDIDDYIELDDYLNLGLENKIKLKRAINIALKIVSDYKEAKLEQELEIQKHLTQNWSLDKVNIIIRATLIAALFEMQYYQDLDIDEIITDYCMVSEYFLEKSEVSFIHRILLKLSANYKSSSKAS